MIYCGIKCCDPIQECNGIQLIVEISIFNEKSNNELFTIILHILETLSTVYFKIDIHCYY